MTIHLLSGEALSDYLSAPKSTGINPIFLAAIRVESQSLQCYVKPTTDFILCPATRKMVENKELHSEALGYVLADAVGLQVPDNAGVIWLDLQQIPEVIRPALTRIGGGIQDGYLCWFSRDMGYPNLKQLCFEEVADKHLAQSHLAKQLSNMPDAHQVAAFDDWLLNTDRNLGNLLSAAGRLLVIDHGRLFHYPNWIPGEIGCAPWLIENRLIRFIDERIRGWSDRPSSRRARMVACNRFKRLIDGRGARAAKSILLEFFREEETDAVINLLCRRAN